MTGSQGLQSDFPPCGCSTATRADAKAAICYCAVEDLLQVIRRRYSLAVLNAIHTRGEARYFEIEAAVAGASTSTLAEMLHALETAALVTRHADPRHAPRTTYTLTSSGSKLLRRFRRLLDEIKE